MINATTSFHLIIPKKDKKSVDAYPILGMEMEGHPNPVVKRVKIYKDTVEQMVDFDDKKMAITENLNESIIKIRILNNHAVLVRSNRNMNNIELLGIIELGKAQIIKNMFDESNRKQMASN